jgi:hypothetical protein
MEKHCTGSCCNDTDVALDYPILPMSADSTKGLMLVGCCNMILEKLHGKDTIVTVNMFDRNVESLCK